MDKTKPNTEHIVTNAWRSREQQRWDYKTQRNGAAMARSGGISRKWFGNGEGDVVKKVR
jgi:hypothetical protein